MRHFDLALLRTFVAIADRGSMTAAADALHLTQGAVSQQVARLEAMVGAKTFLRTHPGLRLTTTGEKLLFRARKLLAENDDLIRDLVAEEASGTIRLGVCYDLMSGGMADIIRGFCVARPNIDIVLTSASSAVLDLQIGDGRLDFAVLQEYPDTARGEVVALDRLVWVGAPSGGAQAKRPLPLSLVSADCIFRQPVLEALTSAGVAWRTVFENGGYEATTATVRADLAVSAWLSSAIPLGLEALPHPDDLPPLPMFTISLRQGDGEISEAGRDLARQIRRGFGLRADMTGLG